MVGFSTKKERESVFLMARLDAARTGVTASHRVRNLSVDGVCVEHPGGLEKFTRLAVSIGQLDNIPAEVAWARGGFAGLKFLAPVDVQSARKHRGIATEVRAGWMNEIRHAHRI